MRQVQEALKGIGIPVMAGVWRATSANQNPPTQYAVYSTTTTEAAHQDDRVTAYRTYVYLNLWSDIDPTDTAGRIRAAMYDAGFFMVEESDKEEDAYYATPVEYGHGGPAPAPAHPFIRPAYDTRADEAYQIIRDGLRDAIDRL